jgi:hypothetical protein
MMQFSIFEFSSTLLVSLTKLPANRNKILFARNLKLLETTNISG